LANFVERTARNDYNWNNPNRRYLNRGFVLPGLLSDELSRVVVANDTSGSTMGVQGHFTNEISGILAMFKTTITVIECDARVQRVQDYQTEDLPVEFEIKGGGGTDFRPVFDHVEKEGLMPSCLIYLTDTYGTFPPEQPDYPVMWVSVVKDGICPWGEVVYLDPKTANVGV
jgi:predicted metal-dependent peptidase